MLHTVLTNGSYQLISHQKHANKNVMHLVGANDVIRVSQYHSFYMLEHHRTSLSIQCNNDLDQLYSNE